MSSSRSSTKSAGFGLALAGVLIFLGGFLHPRADTGGGFDATFAGLFADPKWAPSHAVTLVGLVILAASLAALVRTGALPSGRLRTLGVVATAGAAISAVEMLPHLFAGSEAEAFVRGEGTPVIDVHLALQAVATPVLGFAVAALALVGARTRVVGHPFAAVLGVVGGVAFGLAGPAILILEDPRVAPLFIGASGIAVWLMVSGILLAGRPQVEGDISPATATR